MKYRVAGSGPRAPPPPSPHAADPLLAPWAVTTAVKAITGMAASLGMDTTAEGVETERQMEMVTGYGCTEVQGYLVSRPCTPADLKAVFDRYGGFDDSAFAPVSSGDAELWLATG